MTRFTLEKKMHEDSSPTLDEIRHYGVKGMRWGFRRNKSGGFSRSGNRTKVLSEDAAKTEGVKAKKKSTGIGSLSNDELQTAITRMNLEQQFKNLETPASKKKKNAGQQLAEQFGKEFATDATKDLRKEVANQVGKTIFKTVMKNK